ncbi:MAG TPA: hypothetical protein VF253_06245 [Candidatus Limnocylindrales bacterium]
MDQQGGRGQAPRPRQPGTEPVRRQHVLIGYLWSNRDRFGEGALANAASEAGYTAEEIADAAAEVARRRRDEMAARPVRARARRTVLAIYGITFLVFAVLFLRPTGEEASYFRAFAPAALGVLGFVMLVALSIGLAAIGAQRPSADRAEGAFGVMLAVPVILLLVVGGLCVATTGPMLIEPGA